MIAVSAHAQGRASNQSPSLPRRARRRRPGRLMVPSDPTVDGHAWRLTAHVCQACFGRMLVRAGDDGDIFCCAECEAQAPVLKCACTLTINGRSVGLRCAPNQDSRPELPQRFLAIEIA